MHRGEGKVNGAVEEEDLEGSGMEALPGSGAVLCSLRSVPSQRS